MPFTWALSRAKNCRFSRESAKIKNMRPLALTILILSTSTQVHAATCEAPESATAGKSKVDYINERYDDFFRFQQAKEEREAKIQKGVAEVKELREKHELELRRAAQDYKREKKDYALEDRMRIEWEKTQKERDKRVEMARLCEVQQRRAAEELLKKGRKIPELKEFDLEDY